ncbi:MAG: hypothetical protein ABIP75_09410 [Pyrinomonadaceae bacterium]
MKRLESCYLLRRAEGAPDRVAPLQGANAFAIYQMPRQALRLAIFL